MELKTAKQITREIVVNALYDIAKRMETNNPLTQWDRLQGVVEASARSTNDLEICYNEICRRMNVSLQYLKDGDDFQKFMRLSELQQKIALGMMRERSWSLITTVKSMRAAAKRERMGE